MKQQLLLLVSSSISISTITGNNSSNSSIVVVADKTILLYYITSGYLYLQNFEDSRQVKILKKTTTLLNLQNMFRQKDDRSFCRNMFCKFKSVVVFFKNLQNYY